MTIPTLQNDVETQVASQHAAQLLARYKAGELDGRNAAMAEQKQVITRLKEEGAVLRKELRALHAQRLQLGLPLSASMLGAAALTSAADDVEAIGSWMLPADALPSTLPRPTDRRGELLSARRHRIILGRSGLASPTITKHEDGRESPTRPSQPDRSPLVPPKTSLDMLSGLTPLSKPTGPHNEDSFSSPHSSSSDRERRSSVTQDQAAALIRGDALGFLRAMRGDVAASSSSSSPSPKRPPSTGTPSVSPPNSGAVSSEASEPAIPSPEVPPGVSSLTLSESAPNSTSTNGVTSSDAPDPIHVRATAPPSQHHPSARATLPTISSLSQDLHEKDSNTNVEGPIKRASMPVSMSTLPDSAQKHVTWQSATPTKPIDGRQSTGKRDDVSPPRSSDRVSQMARAMAESMLANHPLSDFATKADRSSLPPAPWTEVVSNASQAAVNVSITPVSRAGLAATALLSAPLHASHPLGIHSSTTPSSIDHRNASSTLTPLDAKHPPTAPLTHRGDSRLGASSRVHTLRSSIGATAPIALNNTMEHRLSGSSSGIPPPQSLTQSTLRRSLLRPRTLLSTSTSNLPSSAQIKPSDSLIDDPTKYPSIINALVESSSPSATTVLLRSSSTQTPSSYPSPHHEPSCTVTPSISALIATSTLRKSVESAPPHSFLSPLQHSSLVRPSTVRVITQQDVRSTVSRAESSLLHPRLALSGITGRDGPSGWITDMTSLLNNDAGSGSTDETSSAVGHLVSSLPTPTQGSRPTSHTLHPEKEAERVQTTLKEVLGGTKLTARPETTNVLNVVSVDMPPR